MQPARPVSRLARLPLRTLATLPYRAPRVAWQAGRERFPEPWREWPIGGVVRQPEAVSLYLTLSERESTFPIAAPGEKQRPARASSRAPPSSFPQPVSVPQLL